MKRINIRRFHSYYPEKRKKSRWKAWLAFVLILMAGGGLVYAANLSEYQIKDISVEGAIFAKEGEVISIARNEISKKYFWLIPASHIWLYPRREIEKNIKSAFSSVIGASFEVSKDTRTLKIKLAERKQEFVLCQSAVEGDAVRHCFYMDKTGFIFAPSPDFEGNAFIIFSGEVSDPPVGKNFLPKEQMSDLVSFLKNLKQLGLLPASVSVLSLYDAKITLLGGTVLILSLDKPLAEVPKNLAIILGSSDFLKASGGINSIEYLDLRYGAKAFWKAKGSL